MLQVVFVTQNLNKINDAQKLLPDYEVVHIDFEVPEIQSMNTREIAEFKLKYVYEKLNLPCFVMDTALHFDCLDGFPGPFIKWYYTKNRAIKTCRIAKLFQQPGCIFETTLGYFDGKKSHFITKSIEGTVPEKPRGLGGYSWDDIFIPDGESRTFAEMTFEEKNNFAVQFSIFKDFRKILEADEI